MHSVDDLAPKREGSVGSVRRRHVIFVEGYDPRGARGYFDLLRRTCGRFERLWPVSVRLRSLQMETADFARWRLDVRGRDWETATHYEFLRLENFIRSDMDRSTAQQLLCGLRWFIGDLLSGALFRIFWASWRFGLHLLHFQVLLLAWVAVPAMIAVLVGVAVTGYLGVVTVGVLAALGRVRSRLFVGHRLMITRRASTSRRLSPVLRPRHHLASPIRDHEKRSCGRHG